MIHDAGATQGGSSCLPACFCSVSVVFPLCGLGHCPTRSLRPQHLKLLVVQDGLKVSSSESAHPESATENDRNACLSLHKHTLVPEF